MSADTLLKMSANTQNSTDSSIGITPPDGSIGDLTTSQGLNEEGHTPYVRYGYYTEDGGVIQLPTLHPVDDPKPDKAETVSPIYFLTDDQIQRNESVAAPWQQEPYIANELQDECIKDDRFLSPINTESDSGDDGVSVHTMREVLKEFARECLNVDTEDGRMFFSGGRSVHNHLPLFATNREQLRAVKKAVESFNEDSEVQIDPGNYGAKNQFRLPGVAHYDTGYRKVEIFNRTSQDEIRKTLAQAAASDDHGSASYSDVLYTTLEGGRTVSLNYANNPGTAVGSPGGPRKGDLKKDIATPLVEKEWASDATREEVARWKRYNRHHFSPYSNTTKGWNISVFTVKGSPFCRVVDGIERTLVPAYIHGAVGGDGEFMIEEENGPIYLSSRDYGKWDYETGDMVVMIGGHSSSSTIITLEDAQERDMAAAWLTSDDMENSREVVLDCLSEWGYDTGAAGKNPDRQITIREGSQDYESGEERTQCSKFQKDAENGDIRTLTEHEQLRVSNRLLAIHGWDYTRDWFKEQYGDDYDEETVVKKLQCIVSKYDDLTQGGSQ